MASALGLVGTGMQAYGQYQAGNVNAMMASQRAQLANTQAQSTLEQGAGQEAIYRQKGEQFIGKQAAARGASGIAASGSPMRVLEDTAGLQAADIARIRNNAALEAWGFRASGSADLYNAKVKRAQGTGSALGTLLMGTARNRGIWSPDSDY